MLILKSRASSLIVLKITVTTDLFDIVENDLFPTEGFGGQTAVDS